MASLMDELINTLREEVGQYEELLVLADLKREVLVKGDIDALVETTKREQRYAATLQRLEKKREKIVEDIALVTNQPFKTLTVAKIADMIKSQENESRTLIHISKQLVTLLNHLKVKNELNTQLTEQSLAFIDFTFNALKSSSEQPMGNNYQQRGTLYQNDGIKNYFDARQ